MTIVRQIGALAMVALLAGCQGYGEAQQGGMLGDVAAERLLGSKVGDGAATFAVGALLGPYQGTEVGQQLDGLDQSIVADIAHRGLETSANGVALRWTNPESGHAGSFTPINSYSSNDGLRCRDYQQSITAEGRKQDEQGSACRTDDGAWRVVATPVRRSLR